MSKDPAFLFYSSDFLTGTSLMSDEQIGKYIRLLCFQHQKGRLSEKDMLKICLTYDEDIFSKFTKDDSGLYFNERLDAEVSKRAKFSESRRNNRLSGNKQKKEKNTSTTYDYHMLNTSKSYVKHMENENENINENINNKKGGVGENNPDDLINTLKMPSSHKTQFETTFLDIEPTEYIRINHPQLYEVQCMQNKIKPMHIERFNLEYRYHPFENLNHLINAFKAFCKKMYNEEHNPTGGKTNGKRSQSIGTGSKKTFDNTGSLLAT